MLQRQARERQEKAPCLSYIISLISNFMEDIQIYDFIGPLENAHEELIFIKKEYKLWFDSLTNPDLKKKGEILLNTINNAILELEKIREEFEKIKEELEKYNLL